MYLNNPCTFPSIRILLQKRKRKPILSRFLIIRSDIKKRMTEL